ncbi:hypothetical protein EC991_010458 [Linnemannia zychae]|nr:hypothetical protein EC991_010458 [Linnemannia zychae]
MATTPQGQTIPSEPAPSPTSKPSSPPSEHPTVDPPKTTEPATTEKPTTTEKPSPTTMSTVEPPVASPSKEPPVTTAAPTPVTTAVTTADPPVTEPTSDPPTTKPTTDPPVTTDPPKTTADPPVTTTDPPVITTDPPKTTADPPVTTSKDPPVITSKDPPVITSKDPPETTKKDPPHTTRPPYTTRYVTTVSIITVTTVVPQPTVISGKGTTVYITRSTTSPVPTVIQDPTQEPPSGTQIDPSTKESGLLPWQITLIIVATLVMMGAVGAVVLVGRVKRQRRKRDSVLLSRDGFESAHGSEMGESGGAKSNRTLFAGAAGGGHTLQQQYYLAAQGGNGDRGLYDSGDPSAGEGGGAAGPKGVRTGRGLSWRERFSAWRPWDSHGSYHSQQQYPGHEYQGQGQAGGGLWLLDDPDTHNDRSASAAVTAAAAMRPVSYDTSGGGPGETIVGDDDLYFYGNYPHNTTTQSQDGYYDHPGDSVATYAAAARERERGIAGTLHPLDENHTLVQRSPSSVTTAATAMRTRSQHQHLQQQQQRPGSRGGTTTGHSSPSLGHLERLSGEGSDLLDSHGILHRQSEDWTVSSVTTAGVGVGSGGAGATENRRSLRVDPDQLESHAKFELFRKAPQAILGVTDNNSISNNNDTLSEGQTSPGEKSPPLPSAPLLPLSSSTTTATVTDEIKDNEKDKDITQESEETSEAQEQITSTVLLPVVDDTPLSKPISVVSEQQQRQQQREPPTSEL